MYNVTYNMSFHIWNYFSHREIPQISTKHSSYKHHHQIKRSFRRFIFALRDLESKFAWNSKPLKLYKQIYRIKLLTLRFVSFIPGFKSKRRFDQSQYMDWTWQSIWKQVDFVTLWETKLFKHDCEVKCDSKESIIFAVKWERLDYFDIPSAFTC